MKMTGYTLLAAVVICITGNQAQELYYVTPTNDTSCSGVAQPCLTLNQYVEQADQYFTSGTDIAMLFLPGAHYLCGHLYVTGLENVTMFGRESSSLIYGMASCSGGIVFHHVSYVHITGLSFISCGIANESFQLPALLLYDVHKAVLANTTFTSNRNSGAVWIFSSNAIFAGRTHFVENEDYIAGALYAESSHLVFSGETVFQSNRAYENGGAFYVYNATADFEGYTSFSDNHATFGAAGVVQHSMVSVKGHSIFVNNSASSDGGVLYVRKSNLHLAGNQGYQHEESPLSSSATAGTTIFENNFAGGSGGALSLSDISLLTASGSIVFKQNKAAVGGGAINLYDNSGIEATGNTVFINNHIDISFARRASKSVGRTNAQKRALSNLTIEVVPTGFSYTGGALSVEYSTVLLNGTVAFQANTGDDAGGALVLLSSHTTINGRLQFEGNQAVSNGGALAAEFTTLEVNGDITFSDNHAGVNGGGAFIRTSSVTLNGNIRFVGNTANKNGGAVSVELHAAGDESSLSFIGNTEFQNNTCIGTGRLASQGGALQFNNGALNFNGTILFSRNFAGTDGGAVYLSRADVTFTGNTMFVANGMASGRHVEAGGGIDVTDSSLTFNGVCTFAGNKADLGGAMKVSNTILVFYDDANFLDNYASRRGGGLWIVRQNRTRLMLLGMDALISFVNNGAERGGAIAIIDFFTDLCNQLQSPPQAETCFYQPIDLDFRYPKVQLTFVNNTAVDVGSVVYGGLFDRCGFTDTHNPEKHRELNGVYYFLQTSNFENHDQLEIASDPFETRLCINEALTTLTEISVSVRRGQTFNVSLAAVGESHVIVPVTLRANFPAQTGQDAQLGEGEAIQAGGRTCTNVHYSVRSPNDFEDLVVYAEGPCRDVSGLVTIRIKFLPCPDGFDLSYSECICELGLQRYTNTCNVNKETILREGDFWISPVYESENYTGLIIHSHCPFDYCHSEPAEITLHDTDTQCAFDRSGLLCGKCRSGHSLALGSSRCLDCSNVYIALFLLFAVGGILLVGFLLCLKLTTSVGTINGLIFYANILAVNKAIFFPPNDHSVLSVFIAWLNLDLGIETCFFDGLDAYGKTWLQFLFPLYVWMLVALIIVGSHYSTVLGRLIGSNPVAVLATLLLLSYAKILRTVIAIFSFTYLEYPDGTKVAVWLHDGNISISDPKYAPLLLVAICTLLFLFLPYTLILLLSQWLQARSELRIFRWISNPKVTAFLDAYHAPYKTEYRYWTGMLLLLRCALYLVFSFNTPGDPSVDLLAIAASVAGLTVLMRFTGSIYRKWYLDVLDASFLLNLGLLTAATYHVRLSGGSQTAATYTSSAVALMIFAGIVIYHCYVQLKDIITVKSLLDKIGKCCVKHSEQPSNSNAEHTPAEGGHVGGVESEIDPRAGVPVTFIELREPLSLLTS